MATIPKASRREALEREEALAAIFLRIARNARNQGLLTSVAAAVADLFAADEKDTREILENGGPQRLLRALPSLARGKWRDRWREGIRPIFANLVSAYDRESDRQMGTGLAFDLQSPYLQEWLDQMSLRLAGQVPQTTQGAVERELREGIANGESVPDIAARVSRVFAQAQGNRAKLIARSESANAQNAASWLQAKASGVIKTKTWITARDSRVRDRHRLLEGVTIPLDDEFPIVKTRWPSDPNERCTLVYGIDESQLTPPEHLPTSEPD